MRLTSSGGKRGRQNDVKVFRSGFGLRAYHLLCDKKIVYKIYTIRKIGPYITFTNKNFLIKYLMEINCIHKIVV